VIAIVLRSTLLSPRIALMKVTADMSTREIAAFAASFVFLLTSSPAGALSYACASPKIQQTFTTNAPPGTSTGTIG